MTEAIGNYFLQNWGLILILLAFTITLKTTVFLDRKTITRMLVLDLMVFLLSIVVYLEFLLADLKMLPLLRMTLMAVRYSATPFILAHVLYTLVKKLKAFVYLPAAGLALVNILSIFTGIVFSVDASQEFHRGPLGSLPFVVAGLYCTFLVYILIKRSNRQSIEIIPIVFFVFAFLSGLTLPFVFGKAYSHIFCTTIAVALFVYYVFLILQLTKTDALTGLLNRQAFYADSARNPEDITAVVSIDMNGLKTVNDRGGHTAGDEALTTLAVCFKRALRRKQSAYRVGGDEFVILCRKATKDEVLELVERIRTSVADTDYSCSVGYAFCPDGKTPVDQLLKESDEWMYQNKAIYYEQTGKSEKPAERR